MRVSKKNHGDAEHSLLSYHHIGWFLGGGVNHVTELSSFESVLS